MADPEFHNGGGRSRERGLGEGSGRGCAPSPEKIEILPENGGFWCILGLLFTFMQKLVRSMGGGCPPPWIRHDPVINYSEGKNTPIFLTFAVYI